MDEPDDTQATTARELALARRAHAALIEAASQPTAWQLAALQQGVERGVAPAVTRPSTRL